MEQLNTTAISVIIKDHLILHNKTKHKDIRCSCGKCNYKAKYRANLTRHKEVKHEGVKYNCNQCDYQA